MEKENVFLLRNIYNETSIKSHPILEPFGLDSRPAFEAI